MAKDNAVTPERTHCVTLDGQVIRYGEGGSLGAARVLLLFNGIGASVETAAEFADAFENTRVIAFDVPGVGASPAPLLPYRLRTVADLAAALLDHLGLSSVDVFGVSWGGAAAQEFALRHSKRCRTLTLAATTAGFMMVPGQPAVLLKLLSPRRYLDPGYLMQIGGRLYGGVLRQDRDLLQLHAAAMRGPSHRGYLYQLLAVWGWTSWHRLHRVKLPTLVLMGADDPIVPLVNGRIIASRVSRATLQTVDCGHLFVLTKPAETARRVERFMAAHVMPA
ncbi:poly(3-hydroxyalkanoate) depolymerase [Variovorax ginsengisoli]|uniref:Poly(3-hydroxyalkanoate) depolymerase n=1 Tax=Variovorax ginsengisoli TaxID=363844 RepID=A0ABT8SFP1_9BURK|nr:poly(3-hydroxyalkanoate) depolymerase [Variovorax ginsengisoli]MDN8618578.1 poly(3-hydroxyalkanoate) depolymerase [Variovorax ginsengisoli]MDO1537748.1 poly(3-hydroxyalkanoate) depolymerase [Variovorax ginsengisoli]